ncbi:MAG: aldehyde dehydrogenase family protein [Thermoanaerobaculia bacterium]|nr:aldehyde dehydrogenase family protein [Thermoanaerobaculia bacterium]
MTTTGAMLSRPAEPRMPSSSREAIDAAVETLRHRRSIWSNMPVLDLIDMNRKLRSSFADVAEEWAAACMRAEGLTPGSPESGEEWIAGPYLVLRNLRLLQASLRSISVSGRPRIPGPVRTLPNGQVAAEVAPFDRWDRIFYPGVEAEVWMEPGITESALDETLAVAYRERPPGKVALVLSAGNVSSIGPMDALYRLFVDRQVVVYKTHGVNDYLGPLLEQGFAPLVEAGFFRVVYGGVEEGRYLCDHPGVDEIHITGSDKTYEAIVFGPGEEGERRKAEGEPRLEKPITAELGNVSPVVVVPGPWSDSEIRYHAENVATMLTNNAGFNCNAVRVLVTWRGWHLRNRFLDAVRDVLRDTTPRRSWYPGARERFERFLEAHPEAERFGGAAGNELPWTLISGLDPDAPEEICFSTEAFCSLFCETVLEARDPAAFLHRATDFCNEELWGTLNATLLVHPRTREDPDLEEALESAVDRLRYGTVSLNHWAAIGYGLVVTPWGGYPGQPPEDIQSGTGTVHNTLMFDRPQKTVVRAPFKAWPKPPWFLSHDRGYEIGKRLTSFEASPAAWKLPAIFGNALTG